MHTIINGKSYELAQTLRVAYKIQGQHNHTPYSKVFEQLSDMNIEEQIGILFAAFECANPNEKAITQRVFTDYYLDNFNLKEVMDQIKLVISGILGTELVSEATEEPKN